MANKEQSAPLTYNDKYTDKLYKNHTSSELANIFFVNNADFDPNKYDSFSEKYVEIVTSLNEDGKYKYPKLTAIDDTDRAYLCKMLYVNYQNLTQDTDFDLNLENVLSLFNKLLADNWSLYCKQRTNRSNNSKKVEDEKEREKILISYVEMMRQMISSFKVLTTTINLTEIDTINPN